MISKNKFKSRFNIELRQVCERIATNDDDMLYIMDEISKETEGR